MDLARSYMKTRSRWMSPGRNIDFKNPSTVSTKLFSEGTLYSAGHHSVSSSEVHFLLSPVTQFKATSSGPANLDFYFHYFLFFCKPNLFAVFCYSLLFTIILLLCDWDM